MTAQEFQHRYHNYQTFRGAEARAAAAEANAEGIDNSEAVAVHLQGLGWCLMLRVAVDAAMEMGILGPENR